MCDDAIKYEDRLESVRKNLKEAKYNLGKVLDDYGFSRHYTDEYIEGVERIFIELGRMIREISE